MQNPPNSREQLVTTEIVDINTADLVFFDTEFTGLEWHHELIEIGLVKARAKTFEIIAEQDIKIKPAHIELADPQALQIVGYNAEEWANAVDLKTGLEQFLSHTNGTILVGHNLPIDWLQISKALAEFGLKPNYLYKGFDTFPMGWLKLHNDPNLRKFSLTELADHFNIDTGRHHRAIDDARTTYQVFLHLLKI